MLGGGNGTLDEIGGIGSAMMGLGLVVAWR